MKAWRAASNPNRWNRNRKRLLEAEPSSARRAPPEELARLDGSTRSSCRGRACSTSSAVPAAPAHRAMLEQAIAALDAELDVLKNHSASPAAGLAPLRIAALTAVALPHIGGSPGMHLASSTSRRGMPQTRNVVRIAAIGDLHYGRTAIQGSLHPLFSQINESADILVLCGDLTDYGSLEEGRALVRELASLKIPTVAVLGNHDFESGQQEQLRQMLARRGRHHARRRQHGNPRHRIRGRQGVRRRVRPARAGPVGRREHQEVRARGGRRGTEARVGARPSAQRSPDRRPALRAHPGHGRR